MGCFKLGPTTRTRPTKKTNSEKWIKNKYDSKQSWRTKPHEIRMIISRCFGTGLSKCWYQVYFAVARNVQWLYDFGKMEHFWWRIAICRWARNLLHSKRKFACNMAWASTSLLPLHAAAHGWNLSWTRTTLTLRFLLGWSSLKILLGAFAPLSYPYAMPPLLQPLLAGVEDSTFELRTFILWCIIAMPSIIPRWFFVFLDFSCWTLLGALNRMGPTCNTAQKGSYAREKQSNFDWQILSENMRDP